MSYQPPSTAGGGSEGPDEPTEPTKPAESTRKRKAKSMLEITPMTTSKDKIVQPTLAEMNVIPRITSNVIMVGSSGSGKTTLLANLFTRKEFYKGWFDRVVLVSPSARTDDLQGQIGVQEDDIVDDLGDAPQFIQDLMDDQRDEIEEAGADRAPQIALIYDDVAGSKVELLNSEQFVKTFVASRHFNLTTFLLVQSFTQAPRVARLQCQNLFYFRGSNSEQELICEEAAAPGLNKREMMKIIDFATIDPYTFLHFTRREPDTRRRYRRNLDEIILLDSARDHNSNGAAIANRQHNAGMGSSGHRGQRHPGLPRRQGRK